MDTSFSVPPPGHPPAVPVVASRPVGDLKRLDSRRVLARLLDGLLLLPLSIAAGVLHAESFAVPFALLSLLYFFVTEATGAQTLAKRKLGLRVMQRDGSAPTVNQISVRTVLRLIDDGPIGLVVMLLSGKRRQRIGDLLAGTTVGKAEASVPTPASSPLLVVYPVGWLIAGVVWFAAGADARKEEGYRSAVQAICSDTAQAGATPRTLDEWLPFLADQRARHAALSPPDSLRAVHAELLAIEGEDLAAGHVLADALARGDIAARRSAVARARSALERRHRLAVAAGLPACA